MSKILFLLLLLIVPSVNAQVLFNNMLGLWVGNVCVAINGAWSVVPFQPIGSFCQIITPTGIILQGQIVNG